MMLTALLLGATMTSSPVTLRLGPDGELLAFLASGPFPNVGALELKGNGFATDYLNGEAAASPKEGEVIPMIDAEKSADPAQIIKRRPGWVLGTGNPTNGIDLYALLDGSKPAVAYLYTTLISPSDRQAQILFGSDDGAKVYVNGELLFQKQVARGIKRDEDRVPIHLHVGANQLLFKIEQGNGGWGLLARIADGQGRGMTDVTERLDVLSSGDDDPWIRTCAGKPGVLDLTAARAYDQLTKRAALWVERFQKEADHPEALASLLTKMAAEFQPVSDAGALTQKLISASQEVKRQWDQCRRPMVEETQKALPQVTTQVAGEDYISVMPGGRYFVHADGRSFIPIGYNHNPDWPEFEQANPEGRRYEPERTEHYVAHLREKGVNVIRLMLETPQSGNMEDPIGTFSPEHVRWIDTIVAAARKYDIKLIVTPWDTFWMNLRFDASTYNPLLGGPLKARLDFITDSRMREVEKKRLKFMVDRWGNTGTIFSWELLNEGDLWWGETPAQLKEWITDVATYVRDYEHQKWGRNHLISVSISHAMPEADLATDAFNLPVLDYATTHLYIGASKAPSEPIGPALTENQGVRYCLDHITDNRPYIDTENGPIDKWIKDGKLDDEVFFGMTWAHLASGGAGSGFRWPYRSPHHLSEGMLDHLHMLSQFVAGVPWRSLTGAQHSLEVTTDDGQAAFGIGSDSAAIAWTSGHTFTVNWATPHARYKVFDCHAGVWITKDATFSASPSGYVITAPEGVNGMAVVLMR